MTMEYGHISGVAKPIARLVQGTVMVTSKELERSFALLDAVFELGGTTFDTAHGYGGGDCERTVGRWVRCWSLERSRQTSMASICLQTTSRSPRRTKPFANQSS